MKKLLTIIAVASLFACNDAPPDDDKEPGDAKRQVDTSEKAVFIEKKGGDTLILKSTK